MWPFTSEEKKEEAVIPPVKKSIDAKTAAESLASGSLKSNATPSRNPGGFDPEGLERAAKAARELQDLKYADEAINLVKATEKRQETEALATIEENKAKQKAFEAEHVRIQEQERRQTLQADHKLKQEQAYYSDQLARKRHQDSLNAQRAMKDQQLKREEEFQLRVESMKRQTAEYEANLRKNTEKSRAEAEAEGRTIQERKNWDLHMQRSAMEAREFRGTILESVREAGSIIGKGLTSYLNDREKLATTAGTLTLIAAGIYGAKVSTGIIGRFVEARLGKPPLVRETSRRSVIETIKHPLKTASSMIGSKTNVLEGVVVEPTLHTRLSNLALSTKNTKKNGAPYRHMMLYGPPGTGKTMFAKQLAHSSGMDYAILTGGDVAPLGRDGVTEMHKLFDWANTSRKGLLLFVDEADAFLRKRTDQHLSEDLRNSLNAFLYRTGTETKNFMIVFATNEPDQLDWAVNDRTDELVHFALPGTAERQKMLELYFEKYIVNGHQQGSSLFGGPSKIVIGDDFDDFASIAQKTEGFSGREISKLAIAWQAAAYGSPDCTITKDLVNQVLNNRLEQHIKRSQWSAEEAENRS